MMMSRSRGAVSDRSSICSELADAPTSPPPTSFSETAPKSKSSVQVNSPTGGLAPRDVQWKEGRIGTAWIGSMSNDNIGRFRKLLGSDEGVLFVAPGIMEVGYKSWFSGTHCVSRIYLGNLSQGAFENLSVVYHRHDWSASEGDLEDEGERLSVKLVHREFRHDGVASVSVTVEPRARPTNLSIVRC